MRKNAAMRITSGAMAGVFASFFTYPIDVVRAKLTVQDPSCRVHRGMDHLVANHVVTSFCIMHALLCICCTCEGFRRLDWNFASLICHTYIHLFCTQIHKAGVHSSVKMCEGVIRQCTPLSSFSMTIEHHRQFVKGCVPLSGVVIYYHAM